jgi:hypothetical protein
MPRQEGTIRPFADVLADLGRGQVADEVSVALADLVTGVTATGKKGTLTLKIDVEPFKGGGNMIRLAARVDTRAPQGEPLAAVFYADDAGSLHRNDPNQEMLPLREVAHADADLRGAR